MPEAIGGCSQLMEAIYVFDIKTMFVEAKLVEILLENILSSYSTTNTQTDNKEDQ